MYHEFRDPSRTGWKYPYKGSELLEAARKQQAIYHEREMKAREQMAVLLRDREVGPSDDRISKLQKEIESSGSVAEQCDVFVHEFARNPDREFLLSLSDVVFFGLTKQG